jgi:hypothetical protein
VARPVGIGQWADLSRSDSHAAVRALTEDLAAQLSTVSPTYPSWAQAELLSRVAEVVVRTPGEQLPGNVAMVDQVTVAARLATVQQSDGGDSLRDLLASFATYERDLSLLGLNDSQVVVGYSRRRLRLTLLWSVLKVAAALPFAALGVIIHVVPFQIVKQLAKQPTNESIRATVKLLGCFVMFLVVYVALGIVAGRAYGAWVGFIAAVAAPLCGYVAVRLIERVKSIEGLVQGYRTVRERQDVLGSVIAHRKSVMVDACKALMEQ